MSDDLEFMWSNTDFPYACLIDEKRTLAFKEAIFKTVKKNDVVLEVGAGTGILSLFAAQAGAKKVYAVEIDPLLSRTLVETVKANGFEDIIEVVGQDIFKAELPTNIDVLIGELIETGLLDEMQVKVINYLHEKGTINPQTRLIPQAYKTEVSLVNVDNTFYGFKIAAPMHNWPNYSNRSEGWAELKIEEAADPVVTSDISFSQSRINPNVDITAEFKLYRGVIANAVRISGHTVLTDGVTLGACNTYSGDKILPFNIDSSESEIKLNVKYRMGDGLSNLEITQLV